MHKTRDASQRTLVVIVKPAVKNEVTEVVLYETSRPVPFNVIVHRDVVIGELLELEEA